VRVEGAERHGVLIYGEEVGVVFFADEVTQGFFLGGVNVRVGGFVGGEGVGGGFEEGFGFEEGEPSGFFLLAWGLWGGEEEVPCVFIAGGFDDRGEVLGFRTGLELPEDEEHEALAKGEDFVVVGADWHFEIQTCELGEVAFGVAVFGAEDGADAEDRAQVAGYGHLFGELRGLRQVGFAVEVGDFEDGRATFCGGAGEVGGLDLCKTVGVHVFREEGGYFTGELDNGVGGWSTDGDDAVVETGFERSIWVALGIEFAFVISCRGRFGAVFDLEGELFFGLGDGIDTFDMEFEVGDTC